MSQLLRHLPKNSGMALVLVQHLDPTHESALTALLSRATTTRVTEAKHNVELERNCVYVIPPNKIMGIAGRKLKLLPRKDDRVNSVNYFFRTLAEAEGSSSIGVVLSGNGSDGTAGLQEIKAAGGITFAQDEVTAKYPAMPGSAILAKCVDFVLPPNEIARELSRIAGHPYIAPAQSERRARPIPTEEKSFEDILTTLRQRAGVDFTHYKHATLRRRIQRRMVLHKFEKQRYYAAYVRSHAAESKELFNDILIHVTGFFRDPAVFGVLRKKVIPRLLKKKAPDEPLRIWVPGCSTGEEVYSVAMVVLELMADRDTNPLVQMFGTDINETALAKARVGYYPNSIEESVSTERLRRFFVKQEGGYRINKAIREMCIFARQNLVVDPPFSNLDMISCRNVLIYLDQPLQRKVIPVFHYALKSNGLLVLGASETIGSYAELFVLVEPKAKVYAKKGGQSRPLITFGQFQPAPPAAERTETPKPQGVPPNIDDIQRQAERILLTHYNPAGVIINDQMDVLQFRGRTGLYFEHAHGEASLNLLKMAREGLLIDLRACVSKAMKQNARVRVGGARVKHNGGFTEVAIEVVPFQVPPSRDRYYLVMLEPATRMTEPAKTRGKSSQARGTEPLVLTHLREELANTRESLQAIIEEQEATNEELRSANEEIMSSNEELQSTNEELETAKEELQSTNEELTTLNEELENRNNEMDGVNNDLHNLLASANIPIIILGRDLRIRRFTVFAEKLFNLIPADIGRPVTDIALRVEVPELSRVVSDVIESLATHDVEARDKDGHWWSVRVRPYKTTDNRIDGAVIALVDIDAMKSSLDNNEAARKFAEGIVNTVSQPLVVLDGKLTVKHVNDAFLRVFKVSREETLGRRIYDLGDGQWNIRQLRELLEEILPRNTSLRDFPVDNDFPRVGRKEMVLNAHRLVSDHEPSELILLAMEERRKLE